MKITVVNIMKKIFVILFILAVSCANNEENHKAETDNYIPQYNRPLIEAHRGNSMYAPENTLAAFKEAIHAGADRIEIDLKISSDNRLVVIHDQTINRTTNDTGRVNEMIFDELRSLDAGTWKDKKYAGEKIPTLTEVINLAKNKCMVNIDLKDSAAAVVMAEIIKELKAESMVCITGKIPACVDDIRSISPSITMFYENSPDVSDLIKAEKPIEAITLAIKEARMKNLPGFLFHHRWINEEVVYMAHLHGLAVNVWGVNELSDMKRMINIGVDAIMTDDPALLKKTIQLSK